MQELTKAGLMQSAGSEAFARRKGKKAGYSFEERPRELPPAYEKR